MWWKAEVKESPEENFNSFSDWNLIVGAFPELLLISIHIDDSSLGLQKL